MNLEESRVNLALGSPLWERLYIGLSLRSLSLTLQDGGSRSGLLVTSVGDERSAFRAIFLVICDGRLIFLVVHDRRQVFGGLYF